MKNFSLEEEDYAIILSKNGVEILSGNEEESNIKNLDNIEEIDQTKFTMLYLLFCLENSAWLNEFYSIVSDTLGEEDDFIDESEEEKENSKIIDFNSYKSMKTK